MRKHLCVHRLNICISFCGNRFNVWIDFMHVEYSTLCIHILRSTRVVFSVTFGCRHTFIDSSNTTFRCMFIGNNISFNYRTDDDDDDVKCALIFSHQFLSLSVSVSPHIIESLGACISFTLTPQHSSQNILIRMRGLCDVLLLLRNAKLDLWRYKNTILSFRQCRLLPTYFIWQPNYWWHKMCIRQTIDNESVDRENLSFFAKVDFVRLGENQFINFDAEDNYSDRVEYLNILSEWPFHCLSTYNMSNDILINSTHTRRGETLL